ncbi:hypothetical protein MNBD_GAMMA18-411 [hydrothermal vent metagenome]|uniref:Uncharacterized protein n=1 Tax=hydrothermal vent metagenome TaxID=652676 RepID=A0A3B0Z0C9_9ZZZZ
MHVAGIDVGSKELVVSIRKQGRMGKARTFENTPVGQRDILKALTRAGVERVCLEATGTYHLDLAVHVAPQLPLMVVNPRAAKRHAEALMCRTKTDPVDASVLSDYAERMPFVPWQPPAAEVITIRACSRRLAALTHQRTQAKNQLHAWAATTTTPAFIIKDVQLTIRQLDQQIEQLKEKTLEIIVEDDFLSSVLKLFVTVKGIAETSAIQLMGELLVLDPSMTHRQWVAMAGLDPRHYQSGTSVNKRARISKAGNRYLRMALYMPALSAARHDPYVRGFYQHLVEDNGLKKIQAVCAVMRKLLHALHGMLKNMTAFDNTRFYRLPVTSSE